MYRPALLEILKKPESIVLLVALTLSFVLGLASALTHTASENAVIGLASTNLVAETVLSRKKAAETLGRFKHWGKYVPAQQQTIGGIDLSQIFQLVGIERVTKTGHRAALLLFTAQVQFDSSRLVAKPDSGQLIKIEQGQTLFDNVVVSAIGANYIELSEMRDEIQVNEGQPGNSKNQEKTAPQHWRLPIYLNN